MLSKNKSIIEKPLAVLARHLSFVDPNFITLIGIIPPILFFIFIIKGSYLLALITFAGNILDLLDGAIARTNNKVTSFGGFLDSTLDRIADFLIISTFGFSGLVRWEIIAPLLLFSFLISYTRSRGELASDKKTSFAVGIIERTERLLIIIIAVILYVFLPKSFFFNNILEDFLFLLLILSIITFLQRVFHARKKL